jgi:ATP-dependent DNA helicase DinG
MNARALLGPDGPIAAALPRYEARNGQLDMAEAVERALDEDRVLLCEAGTGTGKTLAYLVPALRSGRKVVVSTASRALQEQIATKDVPSASLCVEREVVTRVVKGLSNYLCLRRFDDLRVRELDAPADVRRALPLVERWASQTTSGDVAELGDLPEDHAIWRAVASSSETRVGGRCRFYQDCHVTRMKRRALDADVLVVNHHLLMADLAIRGDHPGAVLPDYDALIIDEAHKLEDVATMFFGVQLAASSFRRSIHEHGRGDGGLGELTQRASKLGDDFFAKINLAAPAGERCVLEPELWSGGLDDAYHALDDALDAMAAQLADAASDAAKGQAADRVNDLRRDLASIVEPQEQRVCWLSRQAGGLRLSSAPVDVGPALRERLFGRGHAVVMTSASLTADSDFSFLRSRLGLEEELAMPVDELVVDSSIDHQAQALLYTPTDLPAVDDPAFSSQAAARIAELVAMTPGGAFVLCTSRRSMRALASELTRRLAKPPAVQGQAPKALLLERFRRERDAVLIATMSFWEGVDVPGEALALVVIDRIPFAVPTDPVIKARSEALERSGRSSFRHYSLPKAAITLKQGFGRLLRGRDDRGVVAILDRRLSDKAYGSRLIDSLPSLRRTRDLGDVEAFWAELSSQAAAW